MTTRAKTNRDISGYATFADGEYGAMHVLAHELLDAGEFAQGHKVLGDYLHGRMGSGSAFLHLHWHMLVFELEVGDARAAQQRFIRWLLPAGLETDEVRTDVPSAMWRLELATPGGAHLPWERVCRANFGRRERKRTAQTELYDLLLLGGAGDADALEAFVSRTERRFSQWDGGLDTLANALVALACGETESAALLLHRAGAELAGLIGSAAQAALLGKIAGAVDSQRSLASHPGAAQFSPVNSDVYVIPRSLTR